MTFIRIYSLILYAQICFLISKQIWSKESDELLCYCDKKDLKCKGVRDFDILEEHFTLANLNCSAKTLRISNSYLPALPDVLLCCSSFTKLRIDDSDLPFFAVPVGEERTFIDGNLNKIYLESVRYPYNWNWSIFNGYTKLSELRITKCDMLYIGPSFNDLNLPFLESLVIKNSGVRWIHDKAFASLTGLAFLNLMNNQLQELKRSFFPNPALNLAVMNLRSNILEFLDENIFENMPMITYVNLENNHLVTISEFPNTGAFYSLSGNPLQCDCTIEWLKRVMNATDSYRLRCLISDKSILVKSVDWKELDC